MTFEITPVSIATAIGLFFSTSFFAVATSTSFSAIPALILSPVQPSRGSQNIASGNKNPGAPPITPSHLIRQWKAMFDRGKKAGPFLTGLGAASWLYVASVLPAHETQARGLYIAGAMLSVGVVPFTFTVMRKNVKDLVERAATADSGEALAEEKNDLRDGTVPTTEVLRQWAKLNFVRAFLPLAGVACVIVANV